jgi:hypothetical protein
MNCIYCGGKKLKQIGTYQGLPVILCEGCELYWGQQAYTDMLGFIVKLVLIMTIIGISFIFIFLNGLIRRLT